jgi:hypothetical protein
MATSCMANFMRKPGEGCRLMTQNDISKCIGFRICWRGRRSWLAAPFVPCSSSAAERVSRSRRL